MYKNKLFFRVEKWSIFVSHPVLDSGRDSSGQWTVDSGQWTVDSGQWTVDSGQWTGQLWTVDSGQAILYWTDAARGRWTSGQWTGQSGQRHCPYSRILRVTLASF